VPPRKIAAKVNRRRCRTPVTFAVHHELIGIALRNLLRAASRKTRNSYSIALENHTLAKTVWA
jgi:hypothetical protein